jgi:hypothetical protein
MAKKTRVSSAATQSPWHRVDPDKDLPKIADVLADNISQWFLI